MGVISWVKSWSSSDTGTILGGADLQNIQNDITTVVNGGVTNVNVNASAGIVESKLAFDATGGHNHDGSNSKSISAGSVVRASITGVILTFVATDQIKSSSGVIEINGALYTRSSYSTTIDLDTDAHWVEAASQRAILLAAGGGWAYIYAYNDTGTSWDIKYWRQPPQFVNCGADNSGPLIFRQSGATWYRCVGVVRVNVVGSGEINNFFQDDNLIMWDVPIQLTNVVSAGVWSAATSCSAMIPSTSTLGVFYLYVYEVSGTCSVGIRPNGSVGGNIDSGYYFFSNQRICFTDASQQINYYNGAADTATVINVEGFYLNIR